MMMLMIGYTALKKSDSVALLSMFKSSKLLMFRNLSIQLFVS